MAQPSLKIELRNLKGLQRKLKLLEMSVSKESLDSLLYDCIRLIKDEALRNVRRLFKRQTGNLENSLVLSRTRSPKKAGAWMKFARKLAPHAHLLEFGHRVVGPRPKKTETGKFVQGRPFFRPAVDVMKPVIRKRVRDQVKALLGKAIQVPVSETER